MLELNHKMHERISVAYDQCRLKYVEATEKKILFEEGQEWKDIEADVDLGKELLPIKNTNHVVTWDQWGGIIERGNPKSLVLQRLNPQKTKPRALVPFANGTGNQWPRNGWKAGK